MIKPSSRSRLLLALAPLWLAACQPLSLDPFLYDPLPAPEGGYQLSTAVIPAHEDLFVATPDGERIHVAHVPARTPDPGAPVLVYFHGQSNNIGTTWRRIELLYPLGWPIYAVDPRGYGRSSGTPSEAGIVTDLTTLAGFLSETRGHEAGKLVIYGYSLGGAFAVHLATLAAPRALITEATFTSVAALVADGAYAPLPVSFVAESRWDSLGKIAGITSPYLVLHGTADPYVQYRYATQLIDAHRGRHHLLPVPGADHGNVPDVLAEQYLQAIRTFVVTAD